MADSAGQDQRAGGVTIYDVAEAAGVATSTVSRAFSRPGRVSPVTHAHIMEVAQRLGYQPNPLARALPSGRTTTAAVLVPDITNPHFFGVIRGAERQAAAAGYTLIVADTEESGEQEARHVSRLSRAVDGFILASSRMSDDLIREFARDHRLTLVNRELAGLPSVVVDQMEGTRQIVGHLASLGHRSVVFLAGPRTSWLGARRWRSLSTTAKRAGITATRLGPFPPMVAGGAAAADAALAAGASAVVAHNDLLAIGVLQRLAERGVAVPGEVSVVGFDDIFGADFCSPGLTTLAGPLETAGRTAIDLLLARMDPNRRPGQRHQVVLPAHLVVRGSTGPARAE
ncbi:MAG TPA: LacI family DNA-binding transcriptional regulator [Egicoccus sp.]|nr:LacI family DNA-binding transcriptional regulator [Egicoccus sp.]HSK24788.1 LacI family DNA-binding transcriptional regulator [Egicoccus sp.]